MRMSLEDSQFTLQQVNKISSLNPQLTYSYIVRDQFYALVPSEMKQYYFNYVRLCLNWYHGYVPEFHDPRNGIFSTRIGNSIIKELTKLIVGGQVFFRNKYEEKNPKKLVNETLTKFQKYSDKYHFQSFVKKLVEYTLAGGTSAIVSKINSERELVPSVYRIDQFFHTVDFSGRVVDWTGFIKAYTAEVNQGEGRSKAKREFYLLEKRYYNESGQPVYKVYIKAGMSSVVSAQSFDVSNGNTIEWENLPRKVKTAIKEDYGNAFRIGEEIPISTGIRDLGVVIVKYTPNNTIPEVDLGESALGNIVSYMIGYEQAFAEMLTDLYLARGKVLLPQQMRNPQDPNNAYYAEFDSMLYAKVPYMNPEDQKPISIQFELRIEEWTRARNNYSESMASAIGVSGSDVFSYLRDATGSSKTATQIASEAQKTVSYTEEKRVIFTEAINEWLDNWKEFNNVQDDFGIRFSSQNHVNMLVTTEQTRVMNEVGFDMFTIFQHFFPDMDSAQIKEMVERKFEQLQREEEIKAMANGQAFMNAVGNQLQGGVGDNKTLEELAKKHGVSVETLQAQLDKGIKVEMEHTNDTAKAREIAIDHITESATYYDKLKSVEDGNQKTNK